VASLVSVSYGALFTRSQRPRVAAHRTFGAEAAWNLAPAASRLSGHHARDASSSGLRRSRRAALLAPSKPSAPKHDRPCLRHRRSALLRWAAPAGQNSHDSKNISVSVRPAFRRLLGATVAAREPKPSAWPAISPTGSPDLLSVLPSGSFMSSSRFYTQHKPDLNIWLSGMLLRSYNMH
jgi:hypothetical protein